METETNLLSLQPLAIFQPQFVRPRGEGLKLVGSVVVAPDGGGGESWRKIRKRVRERGRLSRNQRSQKSFSSELLPRPARLNFFSAQEFSYYSEFQAAYRAHIHAQRKAGVLWTRAAKSSPSRVTRGWGGWWFTGCRAEEISFHRRTLTARGGGLNLLEIPRIAGGVRDSSKRRNDCSIWLGKKKKENCSLLPCSKPFKEDLS